MTNSTIQFPHYYSGLKKAMGQRLPPTLNLAEQSRGADWEQRPLLRRSRCSQQLTPSVRLQKISWDHLAVFAIWHETYPGISGHADEARC